MDVGCGGWLLDVRLRQWRDVMVALVRWLLSVTVRVVVVVVVVVVLASWLLCAALLSVDRVKARSSTVRMHSRHLRLSARV